MACDEPLVGPGVFRLRIGGVTYDENHGAQFIQERCDSFRDGTLTKWLCVRCATQHKVFIDDLEYDVCGAINGSARCGSTFEPVESPQSETVLLVEWGTQCKNASDKGPDETFIIQTGGHIHFNCACDAWEMPIWNIEPTDTP
jgi:hypothetical protein